MKDNNPIANKVVLITGAARRIGAEIAELLHGNGMRVVLHYNESDQEAQALAEKFNDVRPNSAITVGGNLLELGTPHVIIEKAFHAWNRLDALVNNASRFFKTQIGKVTEFAWEELMNSNARAPFFLSQEAASHLKEQKGCIINITDIHAESPMRDYCVYSISKSALWMMTKSLARELGPDIRVNAVAPGAIVWPEGQNSLSDSEKQKILAQTALRREGGPLDIAKAVLFLIRDADYITGQVINVDAGRSI